MKSIFISLILSAAVCLSAAEYFVSTQGSDKGVGTEKSPFRTLNFAARKLKNGDTLTILPGRYFEGVHIRRPLKNVTIKAKYPGSVFLHGDVPAPAFKKVPGYRFVYAADWKKKVLAVNERDTLKIYLPAVSVSDLEYRFGQFIQKDGKLYISCSDGDAPAKHDLSVSLLRSYGLHLEKPENVKIDGLVVSGFYSKQISYWSGVAGIRITSGKNVTVSRCKVFLCSSGINFMGRDILVENCIAYANGSRYPTSAGNFIGWGGKSARGYIMRNCVSMYRQNSGTVFGMRYYMGKLTGHRIENCVTYGEDGINVKGSDPTECWVTDSYSDRSITALQTRNNVFGSSGATVNGYNPKDISPLRNIKPGDWDKHYADPANHDFRPISRVSVKLPEDIKSGSTILLPPGKYPQLVIKADNVTVKTRGTGERARLAGAVITGKGVHLDNLIFTEKVKVSGAAARVISCTFQKDFIPAGKAMEVAHCRFAADPGWKNFDGFRHSNIGTVQNDLDNGSSLDAFPLGPYRPLRAETPARIIGPFIHQITASNAEIQWWTTRPDYSGELLWGETPACEKRSGTLYAGGYWHAASLTGLIPGQTYYFKLDSRSPLREHHSNLELAVRNRQAQRRSIPAAVQRFTTLQKDAPRRVLRVTGRSINETLSQARFGDTVLIPGGVYSETLRVPVSGITLRNVPGEKVWLDGKGIISNAVILENKNQVVLDGLFFRHYTGYAVKIRGGSEITVSRCFYDGRSSNYTLGMIGADNVSKLTMSNCFVTNGFYGSSFMRCKDLLIRNNVWYCNQINNFSVHNQPYETATVRNNIFFDLVPMKIRNNPMGTYNLESLREENNCYYFRVPAKDRLFAFCHRIEGDAVPTSMTYDEFIENSGLKRTALFANPDMPAMPEILKFKHPERLRKGAMKMTDGYDAEVDELTKLTGPVELKAKGSTFEPWDFSHWMSRNRECIRRNMGLERELFTNGVPNGKVKAVGRPARSFYTQAVNEYYVDLYRRNHQAQAQRLASLKKKADALKYQKDVREKIRKAFAIPEKRSVPAFRECGVLKEKGYTLIKRIYEIRKGDYVAAHIYMPDKVKKAPAVLFLNGHTDSAKAGFSCRRICTTLVLNGCIVMTIDPSGQGERQIYGKGVDTDLKSRSVWQHNTIAKQMNLVGESYASWCALDVIRMLDALFAVPQVDGKRVAVTGNSGGGNMSAVVTALDPRLAAAAPSCYLTTWKDNIENELPCCAEQEPPDLVGKGLEMSDLMIAFAPRAHLILGQKDDFFDARGTFETFQKAHAFYALWGKGDKIDHLIGSYNHGYYQDTRTKMYHFFARHLGFEFKVPEVTQLPPWTRKELDCTPAGSVLDLPGARHPRVFMAEKAAQLAAARQRIPVEKRKAELAKLLDIDTVRVPYFRLLPLHKDFAAKRVLTRFGLETEPGRLMSVLYRPYGRLKTKHPGSNDPEVELFIPHRDAVSEVLQYPQHGPERYALDMRGVGTMTPGSCQTYCWWGDPETHSYWPDAMNKCDALGRGVFGLYNYDYHFWACGEMLGKPYLGGRVRDILGAMKLLAANGVKHIRLTARQQGVYAAALAALFFKDCKVSLTCYEMPPSWGEVMLQDVPEIPHSSLVKGILKYFDLPEIIQLVNSDK